ncbi:MAG: hypothetical protein NTY18_05675 [Deltaproteobacteria bacterium]|nr:hypothetical protein [Deltaproteobacteria bacterium]
MLLLLAVLLAAPPATPSAALAPATADVPASVRNEAHRVLVLVAAGDPPIAEVQRAAARHDGVDPERLRTWVARPRSAHWLPRVTLDASRTERDTRVVGVTGTVESDYLRVNPSTQFGVRLSWDLDQLVFSRDEPAAAWTASRLIDRREERIRRATRLYFQRRRLLVQLALDPPGSPAQRAERENQVDEITAELDELTGGLFSGRRTP